MSAGSKDGAPISKSRADKVGDRLRDGTQLEDDLRDLDAWRAVVFEPFGAVLRIQTSQDGRGV